MRLSELIISILISYLFLTGVFFAYTGVVRNTDCVFELSKQNEKVLKTDRLVRNKISEFTPHYLSKDELKYLQLEQDLTIIINENGGAVNKFEFIEKSNIKVGCKIGWSYEGRGFITEDLFAGRYFLWKD